MGLKEYRLKLGMTQEGLARKLDLGLRTYQNIERTNNTSLTTARKIAKALDKTIEELFFDEEEKYCVFERSKDMCDLVKCSECNNLIEHKRTDEEILYEGGNYYDCHVESESFENDDTVLDVDLGFKKGIECNKFKGK